MKKTNFLVKDTADCGEGIFSRRLFRKNQVLFAFGKKVVPWIKANHRSIQLGKNKWLNPGKNDLGFYLNHSCHPNARFMKPHFIAALHAIKPNEEITIDYASVINIPSWDMECACGQKNCRKLIKSYSKSPNDIQKKYKGITSFSLS